MAKTKAQMYRDYLLSMEKFCNDNAKVHEEPAKAYWIARAQTWALAEEGMSAYFSKEDFTDE